MMIVHQEWYVVDRRHFEAYPYMLSVRIDGTECEMEVEVHKPVTIYASDDRMALMVVEKS